MKRGYSLIETVIVIALSTMAFIALVNLYLTFNSIYGYQQAFIATAGSAGKAMNAFEAAVAPASHVLATHTFSGVSYSSGAGALVLELPAIDSSGTVIPGTNDYIVFYTAGTMLYRLIEADAGSSRIAGRTQLSATLSSLAFTYDNADFTKVASVTVAVATVTTAKLQTIGGSLSEKLYLRNLSTLP